VFATPTNATFPVNGGSRSIDLTDAGGGSGSWTVTTELQRGAAEDGVQVTAPASVNVPGSLDVSATVASQAATGNVTGFFVLTHGSDTRRIPFWVDVDHPVLAGEPTRNLTTTGLYTANTKSGESKVSRYRFPTSGDGSYSGPELVYRVRVTHAIANFGVAVVSGHAVPHVVVDGDENHLVGYAGLPQALNPYLKTFGQFRPVAGAVLPAPGTYDVVFDTRSAAAAGKFAFRFWKNDTHPPTVRVVSSSHGRLVVAITDAGAGVDPDSVAVTLDGHVVSARLTDGRLSFRASAGSHSLQVTASDYQELKNMEDVAPIKPNTVTVTRTVRISG
jgi:hypothetical protein